MHGFLSETPRAGCWVIGGDFRVYVRDKPSWFARKMARWLLQ